MFDAKTMGPVNQIPFGTIKVPPPLSDSSCIALANASVFKVTPSGLPPKSSRFTLFFGKRGLSIRGISKGRSLYRYAYG